MVARVRREGAVVLATALRSPETIVRSDVSIATSVPVYTLP
jgi:hypothetical protein